MANRHGRRTAPLDWVRIRIGSGNPHTSAILRSLTHPTPRITRRSLEETENGARRRRRTLAAGLEPAGLPCGNRLHPAIAPLPCDPEGAAMGPVTPWVRGTAHSSKRNHNLQGEGHPATLVLSGDVVHNPVGLSGAALPQGMRTPAPPGQNSPDSTRRRVAGWLSSFAHCAFLCQGATSWMKSNLNPELPPVRSYRPDGR
jgi:hypothetical protein